MKITDVTVTLFAWDDLPTLSYGPTVKLAGGSVNLGLLSIVTDAGVTGNAFIGGAHRPADHDARLLIQHLKPILAEQNPLDRERLMKRCWGLSRRAPVQTIGAVDVALWDIAGKAAGLPIHQLLGTYRHAIPAYASSPALDSAAAYCEQALEYQELGFRAYKIHAPAPWREDIAVCTAVRKALGDDYPLMLDSGWSYDYPLAMKVGRAIEQLGFQWFEDPLAEWNIHSYVKLRQKLDIPLMATELPFGGLDQYAPWLVAQATDYLRGDVAFKGGITTCIKAAHLAEAFAMNFEIHHGGNSLNNVANLHMAMAIKNCEYLEVLLPHEANKYGLVRDLEIDRDGLIHAPTEPGLGVEIDFDLIKRKTQGVVG